MNFLQVGVKLKAENIQSFIDDFLKIDGISISGIELQDDMILINKIKYKSSLNMSVGLKVERVEDGILSVTIKKIKAINIPISVIPVNFILKMVFNNVNISWISCDGKQIKIDLFEIFEKFNLNFLALDVKDIKITKENVKVMINNINFNMENLINKDKKVSKKYENIDKNTDENTIEELKEDKSYNNFDIEKEDKIYHNYNVKEEFNFKSGFNKNSRAYFNEYSRVRRKIYDKKFRNIDKEFIGKIIFLLPDIGVLFYRLLRDKRVKKSLKILLTFTLIYLINPFDKINNKFSILNKIDDMLLLIFTLNKVFTSIDKNILNYHFDGSDDTLDFLIDSFYVLNQFLGGENINKLYTVFEKFTR